MHWKNQQYTGLIPVLLNEPNWRCCGDGSGVYRLLYCSPATSLGEKVEAYDMLIAFEGLDIGYRVVLVAFRGAPPLARRIQFYYFKPWEVGMLRFFECQPVGKLDPRRPLDRLDRGKAPQQ